MERRNKVEVAAAGDDFYERLHWLISRRFTGFYTIYTRFDTTPFIWSYWSKIDLEIQFLMQ